MNSMIVIAFLGLVAYASAGAIVSPLGLTYGAPYGYAGTDLAGAVGIAQGRHAAYLGKVADFHGKVADAQGKYADYLGKVSDAQAKVANYANKGFYAAGPIAHAGIIGAPAAYGLGYGYGALGYAHAPLIL